MVHILKCSYCNRIKLEINDKAIVKKYGQLQV